MIRMYNAHDFNSHAVKSEDGWKFCIMSGLSNKLKLGSQLVNFVPHFTSCMQLMHSNNTHICQLMHSTHWSLILWQIIWTIEQE